MSYFSPLEQFRILNIVPINVLSLDFSITNFTIVISLIFFFFSLLVFSLVERNLIVPNKIQYFFESIYMLVYNLLVDNVGIKGVRYFPYLFSLFLFLLLANIIGLVPYSFTITSHLITTFSIAIMTFLGVMIICFNMHGVHFFSLFLPPGASLALSFLLVPIEIVSFIFRPISLSVRLFANMMAGHTLLKVIAGFAWSMLSVGGWLAVAHILPLLVLVILMGLELAVAFIQAYVFTILTCIYLNDSIHLH